NFASNNNYALKIVTPVFITEPLTLGQTIRGRKISELGEKDTYTFEGTVGQKLWFDNLQDSSSGIITGSLYTPSGRYVWSQQLISDHEPTILTEAGTYRFVVDGSGDATGSYRFRFLDFADAQSINLDNPLDNPIQGNFGVSGNKTNFYRFNGTKGQKLYFDVTADPAPGNNIYSLYDSSGQKLFSKFIGADYEGEGAILPSDGEYTLIVEGNDVNNDYNYNLQIVTPKFITTALILGETISPDSEITEPGEQDAYTFEGNIGQQLFFNALVGNSSLDAKLYSPSGNLVIDLSTVVDGTPFTGTPFTLTEAGTHRLIIDGVNDTTGSYSFRLSDRALATALELNTPIPGTLETGNEVDLYQFTGTKGTILSFNLDGAAWSGANWVLYDPNNGVLSPPASNSPDFEVALPSDGLYTLAIVGNGTTPVNYSFQVSNNSVAPITLTGTNTTVTGTVANAGDIDSYTFEASAGTLIWLDQLSSTSSNILARLKNPDGTFAFTNHVTTSEELGAIVLQQTGEYTLETFGASISTIGSWQFQILEMPADPESSSINSFPLNSVIEGSLSPGFSTQIYSFSGQVGQQIIFNGMSGEQIDAHLYDPNGNSLFNLSNSNFYHNDSGIITLTQDGLYHLVLNSNSSSKSEFSFQLLDLALGQEIAFNLPVQDVLLSGQESNIYQFSGSTGQKLFFDINVGSSLANIEVYGNDKNQALYNDSLFSDFELQLPENGKYTIYINGGSSQTSINYKFKISATEEFTEVVTPGDGETVSNTDGSLGLFPIKLAVEDERGGQAIQDFAIRLWSDPENKNPAIISTPQSIIGLNQEVYGYQIESIDPDNDVLIYRLLEGPTGAYLDKDTGKLWWVPQNSLVLGEFYDFTVKVNDHRGGFS
ncbi:MAG: hypothetical protein AB4038_19250, partial [Prochloraceae cyanobacterium]